MRSGWLEAISVSRHESAVAQVEHGGGWIDRRGCTCHRRSEEPREWDEQEPRSHARCRDSWRCRFPGRCEGHGLPFVNGQEAVIERQGQQ